MSKYGTALEERPREVGDRPWQEAEIRRHPLPLNANSVLQAIGLRNDGLKHGLDLSSDETNFKRWISTELDRRHCALAGIADTVRLRPIEERFTSGLLSRFSDGRSIAGELENEISYLTNQTGRKAGLGPNARGMVQVLEPYFCEGVTDQGVPSPINELRDYIESAQWTDPTVVQEFKECCHLAAKVAIYTLFINEEQAMRRISKLIETILAPAFRVDEELVKGTDAVHYLMAGALAYLSIVTSSSDRRALQRYQTMRYLTDLLDTLWSKVEDHERASRE